MWAQVINAILGLWLMAAPGIFGFGGTPADNDHIIGPVIATFSIIAWWECTSSIRKLNIPLGAWLLLAPWILGYDVTVATVNDMAVGVLVIGLSLIKRDIEGSYGGGWDSLWKADTLHEREAGNKG